MMEIISFLLCLFLILYFGGLLLKYFAPRLLMWLFNRRMRSAFGENSQRQSRDGKQKNPRREQQRKRPAKKIGSDVGEYVEFEEMRVYTESKTTDGQTTVKIEVEQQITDVEWEDVK